MLKQAGAWVFGGGHVKTLIAAVLLLCSSAYLVVYGVWGGGRGGRDGEAPWAASINTRSMPVPGVTVCNKNEVRLPYFTTQDLLNVGDWYVGVNGSGISEAATRRLPADIVAKFTGMLQDAPGVVADYDIGEFVTRVGHQRDSVIHRCWWRQKTCDDLNIRWRHHLAYPFGNCYTLDLSHADAEARRFTSPGDSLKVHFDAEPHLRNEFSRPGQPGPVVLLHEPGDVPYFHNVKGKTYEMFGLGDIATVRVRKVSEYQEGPPHPAETSLSECRLACESERFLAEKSCLYYDHPGVRPGVPLCKTSKYLDTVVARIISQCGERCRAERSHHWLAEYRVETVSGRNKYFTAWNITAINISPNQDPVLHEVWTAPGDGAGWAWWPVTFWAASVLWAVTASVLLLTTCCRPDTRTVKYGTVATKA